MILLQLLVKGGLFYLVDGAKPRASATFKCELSLVAHSYKPDRFKEYQRLIRHVYPSTLFMERWTPTEILTVAAKLHPQLDTSLVSWQQRATTLAQLYHVALLLPCTCRALLQARICHIKCCMQVKERLNLVAGMPWEVFAPSGWDPVDEIESALIIYKWDDMISGLTPKQAGFPGTASHELLMISTPDWRSGEHSSLIVNSTAVM